jgi:hypothetical protein
MKKPTDMAHVNIGNYSQETSDLDYIYKILIHYFVLFV